MILKLIVNLIDLLVVLCIAWHTQSRTHTHTNTQIENTEKDEIKKKKKLLFLHENRIHYEGDKYR